MSSDFESTNVNNNAGQNKERTESPSANSFDRRHFIFGAAARAASIALPRWARASESFSPSSAAAMLQDDLAPIRAEIAKRHDETVQRMQTWMRQPSIAAENRGMNEIGRASCRERV